SAGQTGATADGASLFHSNCAGCHGADGSGGIGPQLSGGEVTKAFTTAAAEADFVKHGGGGMPAFRDRLSETELQAIVDFTRTTEARTKNTYTGMGNFNSCDVVTQAEAASAIGETATPGGEATATSKGGLACVFFGPAAPAPGDPNREQPDSIRAAVFEGP